MALNQWELLMHKKYGIPHNEASITALVKVSTSTIRAADCAQVCNPLWAAYIFSALIHCLLSMNQAYGSVHRLDDALRVLTAAEKGRGISPGVRAYNAVLASASREGRVRALPIESLLRFLWWGSSYLRFCFADWMLIKVWASRLRLPAHC